MIEISDLLELVDAYLLATGKKEKPLSFKLFKNSSKIAALRSGDGMTVRTFNATVQYLSDTWPEGAKWPGAIARPRVAA